MIIVDASRTAPGTTYLRSEFCSRMIIIREIIFQPKALSRANKRDEVNRTYLVRMDASENILGE